MTMLPIPIFMTRSRRTYFCRDGGIDDFSEVSRHRRGFLGRIYDFLVHSSLLEDRDNDRQNRSSEW